MNTVLQQECTKLIKRDIKKLNAVFELSVQQRILKSHHSLQKHIKQQKQFLNTDNNNYK